MLLYDRNIIAPSSEIFRNFRLSSENVRKMFGKVRRSFGTILKIFGNLRKGSEIIGKSSKRRHWYVYQYNIQNITCPLVDMNFIFSCSTRHLTHSLCSLVRYRVEHSKIKFISTRGHVIHANSPSIRFLQFFIRALFGDAFHL